MNVGSALTHEMMSTIAAVSTLAVEHLTRRQTVIGISAHLLAAIRHVFVAATALSGLVTTAQR